MAHRRWAMRTFMVASGVWFLRLGFFAWFVVTKGALNLPEGANTVFAAVWPFGSYLLPLIVLELYLRTNASENLRFKFFTAAAVTISALLMSVGIFAVTGFFWLPLIAKL